MWHENGTGVDNCRMDENTKPPGNWEMWQMQQGWKKALLIGFIILGIWAFPPILFFIVPYLIIQYRKRNK